MSLRVALGCHPDLGEEDAHVRAMIHGLSNVGAPENLPNGTVAFLGRHPEAMFGHPLLQREELYR